MADFNILMAGHGLCTLVALSMVFVLIRQKPSRVLNRLICCVFAVFIYMAGYMLELKASDLATLMQGIRFRYIGHCLALPFYLSAMLDLCEVRTSVKRWFTIPVFISSVLILGAVLTNDYHHLYYYNYSFVNNGYFSYLETSHGVLYFWQMITTMFVELVGFGIVCRKYWKARTRLDRMRYAWCFLATLIPFAAVSLRSLPFWQGYNITIAGLLLSAVCFLVAITRYNVMDIKDAAKGQIVDNVEDCIVLLDAERYVIYMNRAAIRMFPDMKEQMRFIDRAVVATKRDDGGEFEWKEHHYRYYMKPVWDKNKITGYICQIADDTSSYEDRKQLSMEVENKTQAIIRMQNQIISGIANIIESRDDNTGAHVKKTSLMVEHMVDRMIKKGIFPELVTPEYRDNLVKAAVLHDVGKLKVPDHILLKPGKLTDEEFEVIKKHSAEGVSIIRSVMQDIEDMEYIELASQVAMYHHEWWNGKGYPSQLKSEAIPLGARIMAIADVYDALTSKRCYKPAYSQERAIDIMKQERGTHFDPQLLDVFLELVAEGDTFESDSYNAGMTS